MKFKKTIKFIEWFLFIIISYYIFLTSGALIISIFQGALINNVSKLFIFLAILIISLVTAKIIIKFASRHIYKISSVKILLTYFLSMIVLFIVLPYYINTLLTVFEVFSN